MALSNFHTIVTEGVKRFLGCAVVIVPIKIVMAKYFHAVVMSAQKLFTIKKRNSLHQNRQQHFVNRLNIF